jgi:hypothetical protein
MENVAPAPGRSQFSAGVRRIPFELQYYWFGTRRRPVHPRHHMQLIHVCENNC